MKLTLKHSDGIESEVNSVREAIQATSERNGTDVVGAISVSPGDATLYLVDAKSIHDWQVYATVTGLSFRQVEAFAGFILFNAPGV